MRFISGFVSELFSVWPRPRLIDVNENCMNQMLLQHDELVYELG